MTDELLRLKRAGPCVRSNTRFGTAFSVCVCGGGGSVGGVSGVDSPCQKGCFSLGTVFKLVAVCVVYLQLWRRRCV